MSTENSCIAAPPLAAGRPPVALIAGPTASGKSDLGIRLALALAQRGRTGVVINADSAQVYADLAVLSARPTDREMQGIAHRLFGAWDGAEACSAADWATAARSEIAAVHAAGAIPILVGGTGLYLRTLLEGIAPVPPIDPAIRASVRALPVADAHTALLAEDPHRAARLHPADTTRIARALEVIRSTGRSLDAWQAERSGGVADAITLHPLILLPDRAWVYARCDRRFDLMLESGAIAEVEALMARALDPALPVMRAIGVPEIAGFLRGETTLEAARIRAAQATRHYVKRQFTWLRHQCPEHWPRAGHNEIDPAIQFASLLQE